MVKRRSWMARLEAAWKRHSVVWLAGVRRAGKTVLCRSLPDVEYLDCELPSVRRRIEDPESLLAGLRGRRVVLDEVHRLRNPSEILKIAADHYPQTRICATGSSTLGASRKFRDTLVGRKADVWLTPMTVTDLADFRQPDLVHRLRHGGLPPFFLAAEPSERAVQDWMDAFWAKDIAELFRLERRHAFQRFAELLLAQSGGIFEATSFARPCEVARQTIVNYLAVLEATFVAHVIRPFSAGGAAEIVSAPKVYAFDTGFVCTYRGWDRLRPDDLGILWEHLVLNELHAHRQARDVRYWRDKQGHEVDFVLPGHGRAPIAIECKWSADAFEPAGLAAFRRRYPAGDTFLVAADVQTAYVRRYGDVPVRVVGIPHLLAALGA